MQDFSIIELLRCDLTVIISFILLFLKLEKCSGDLIYLPAIL